MLHPVLYRHIYKDGAKRFARWAQNVWGIAPKASDEETALAGIDALADSTVITPGCCKKLTHDELYDILCECR